ncbi:fibronectin type III domain-containing protein [Paractinoplanes lichenicola]|uniref:Fibronectin type III domain-containing protein n=1 Tax=Paractinoplanes lichenicola TaxID=2802976 RepID=A0ABS1VIV4_9ACTN|nr:fibronectin type III domain-containing protein [Actinoplanes lichenicola]MBL7254421.1 fibronectin type III domain-containing protein [Actinoplanes lichenicola]
MGRRWLGLLVLAPLVLSGCGKDSSSKEAEKAAGKSWVVVANGTPTPSAAPSRAVGKSTPFPTGFLPLPTTTPAPTPTGSFACPPVKNQIINGADATAGTTSGTVTWYNPATADIVEYRITAISQDAMLGNQRDIGWTVVTPGATCGYMTATIVGLDRQTRYVFSVDAVSTRSDSDGTYGKTVARSRVVKTS